MMPIHIRSRKTLLTQYWRRLMWGCLLAAMPGSLFAVDGVVLIDQSHALAGNITPGDAPGFPVTITQPGSYRLSGNLTVPDANTTAILVTADFVTIDLNGFSISGPVTCSSLSTMPAQCTSSGSGNGVRAFTDGNNPSPKATRVLNGGVRGMGSNGLLLLGDGSYVEKVVADSNAGSGFLVNGSVVQSSANLNGQVGIGATVVMNSLASSNGRDGFQIENDGVANNITAYFNGAAGIHVFNGSVSNSTASQNATFGFDLVCPSAIIGNTIVANKQGPMRQDGNLGCQLINNAIRQ